jgi:branched-subunit amino acid aminotransferase/4-amino-4-deoxychorismate lyase
MDGYHPDVPNLILTQHPLILPGREVVEKGVKIITHEFVRDLPEAKTINYSMGIWLDDRVRSEDAADVLYHQKGVVSEFPRCNFFIVTREQKVITPAHAVLQGITRKNVLKLASNKFASEEATVTLDMVRSASEAFLTSTTKRVIPIVAIDGVPIGHGKPGPVALSLLEDLQALESEDKRVNARPQKFYGF